MIKLGSTARYLRESQGVSQKRAAELLEVSVVHLCNVENDKSAPSSALMDRYRDLWGVDLYVLAWCLHGDIEKLPAALRKPASELARGWKERLLELRAMSKEADSRCSTSDG